jgi:small ligand-binding sensory domain FIST
MIRAGSGLSTDGDAATAGRQAAREACADLEHPSVAFVFASGFDEGSLAEALDAAQESLKGAVAVGCSGGGVVGRDREVEGEAAVSIVAVESSADVALEPYRVKLTGKGSKDADALFAEISGKVRGSWERSSLVLLSDPFALEARPFFARLRDRSSKLAVTGGLAAGAGSNEGVPVFGCGQRSTQAAAGVVLSGARLRATVAVAQGCRPIGQTARATRSEQNFIYELDGEPAIEVLKRAIEALGSPSPIFCGLGLESFGTALATGDYLARNIVGVDPKRGAVAVAEVVPQGSWVTFLLRDAETARADLDARVRELKAALGRERPAFGLYFDCLGRGASFYGEPGVDVGIIREHLGDFPLAGFFGNGELAPFLGANFVHNYTGVLLLVTAT